MDIHSHASRPERALVETRNWLTVSRRRLLGERELLTRFRTFRVECPTPAEELDLDPLHITYVDFELILAGWLESRPVRRTCSPYQVDRPSAIRSRQTEIFVVSRNSQLSRHTRAPELPIAPSCATARVPGSLSPCQIVGNSESAPNGDFAFTYELKRGDPNLGKVEVADILRLWSLHASARARSNLLGRSVLLLRNHRSLNFNGQ
jgi:hypothetical protein